MSHTEAFTHPILHVIDANAQSVIFSEEFKESRWIDPNTVIVRGGQRYLVKRQQHGVAHYYVWVDKLVD